MPSVTRSIDCRDRSGESAERLVRREWLVTNGLGGYASGSLAGVMTRRYHGLLVAALEAPLGRTLMLSHLRETVLFPNGSSLVLTGEEHVGTVLDLHDAGHLAEFRLEDGLPVWRYEFGDISVEKRVVLPHHQNTVHVSYEFSGAEGPLRLALRPSLNIRPHDAPVSRPLELPYVLTVEGERYEVRAGEMPPLRLRLDGDGAKFTVEQEIASGVFYRIEQGRGYEASGDLWSPGHFGFDLAPGERRTLVASTEAWETIEALSPCDALKAERARRSYLLAIAQPAARDGLGGELTLAADQFIVTPASRLEEAARAGAAGDQPRTVIAGYHWFTDWGRDTMIALEGLTLLTGRPAEAGYILRTFARHVRDGLIPNLFPEGEREGLYHTADATLWYFHALDRYVSATGDRATLAALLPALVQVVNEHVKGTRFGIGVDPADGLLRQGEPGYQLTWMDAKVDDWVVTPRRGKAVEINALWYNALRLMERWLEEEGHAGESREMAARAGAAAEAFNRRFWYEEGGYLFDVVDGEGGDDRSCRPNQLLAISLPHAVLDQARWRAIVETAEGRLLTPAGLRSLAPGEPGYKAQYYGDLRARDAAYHQGTVWAWLIGPFVDAWLKVHPGELARARAFLDSFPSIMNEAAIGTLPEIFDAEPPFTPRGCISQAWSVAEVLRVWVRTAARRD